jgi:hypothetical protein
VNVVATTVWVDYLKGTLTPEVESLDRELSHWLLGLTDLILCAVLAGVPSDTQATRVQRALEWVDWFNMRRLLELIAYVYRPQR